MNVGVLLRGAETITSMEHEQDKEEKGLERNKVDDAMMMQCDDDDGDSYANTWYATIRIN